MADSNTKQEEFRVSGEEVRDKVKEIIQEGNARRIIIKNEDGKTILEIPLTFGVIGIVLAPALAAVSAVAALVTSCTIVVEKNVEKEDKKTKSKTKSK